MVEFSVRDADVVDVPSDLLLLKHAQAFYGADREVARRLISADLSTDARLRPAPGDCVLIDTQGAILPKRVLFLGTPSLHAFTYGEMELFASNAIEKIVGLHLPVRVMTTTVHGAGYGLDAGEALQRLVRGFRAGLARYGEPRIEKIVFLTLGERSERMLKVALASCKAEASSASATERFSGGTARAMGHRPSNPPRPAPARIQTASKRRVFVALPFSEEFENVYEFGIYPAVRSCGLICERVDQVHFTGDVLGRIRDGIESADLVIADLTNGKPNVYLEVGYAWGKGVPVIFVARKGEKLHFDVSTHRCIFYGRFTQFAKDLEELIRGVVGCAQ